MSLQALRLALQAILRNSTRSFLTVLGVVIGVAAVIAMLTIGQGSAAQVTDEIASLGTNLFMLWPGAQSRGMDTDDAARPFTLGDVEAIEEQLSIVERAAPSATVGAKVVLGNQNHATGVVGTDNRYFDVLGWELARGRAFRESELRAGTAACVLGSTVAEKLFGFGDPLGASVRLDHVPCRVVGVLASKGASSFGSDQDDVVVVPIRTLHRRLAGNQDVTMIFAAVARDVTTNRARRELTQLMRERRRVPRGEDDDFSVLDMEQLSSMLTGVTGVLAGMLSAVAAVSLLVGGIGIMNIMLVSVTERTREIGIRLAIGASESQVLMQFLVEAIVLSLLGGLLGIALGLTIAWFGAGSLRIPFTPSLATILMAFAFSAVVGIVFGFFPARRAARLDPIEALRHE